MTEPTYEQSEALEGKPIKSLNELETCVPKNQIKTGFLGLNAHVIKPEMRVNKVKDVGKTFGPLGTHCPNCGHEWATHNYSCDTIEEETEQPSFEQPKASCPLKEPLKSSQQPICGDKCEDQSLKIISEIEGLISQANDKLRELALRDLGVDKGYAEIMRANEEIDLFQKTTLFELRKAFE